MATNLLSRSTFFAAIAGATTALVAFSDPAQALNMTSSCTSPTGCLLSDLLANGGFFEVGDARFSNFKAFLTGDPGTRPTSLSQISIQGNTELGGRANLDIKGLFFAPANKAVDLNLDFVVKSLSGAAFNAVDLYGNLNPRPGAIAEIFETVFDVKSGDVIGTGAIERAEQIEIALSSPSSHIRINKDILLAGGTVTGQVATLSFVNQQYHVVPTPALLPGLIGMGIAAFRRRKAQATSEPGQAEA